MGVWGGGGYTTDWKEEEEVSEEGEGDEGREREGYVEGYGTATCARR